MIHLLDVNFLIALLDANHLHHLLAKSFFKRVSVTGWATCPIVENGYLRIVSAPAYPNGSGSSVLAADSLRVARKQPGHQFWPDDLSLSEPLKFPNLPASKHLTDCYLLALAVARGGKLATFDRNIDPTWVPGGTHALHVVDAKIP
jgi:toxin-antitoxin system PIN domain toxin